MLNSVKNTLEKLYSVKKIDDTIYINPNIMIDGDGVLFTFAYDENKNCTIKTSKQNNEYLEYLFDDYDRNLRYIDKINQRLKTEFDDENLVISITFRRNEMSLTKAIMNLTQAVYFYSSLTFLHKD